jgi:hypothetical protein
MYLNVRDIKYIRVEDIKGKVRRVTCHKGTEGGGGRGRPIALFLSDLRLQLRYR